MKNIFTTEKSKEFVNGRGWVEHVKSQINVFGKTFTWRTKNHSVSVHDISVDDVQNMALTQMFFEKRLQS